jgi:hypothetical protein
MNLGWEKINEHYELSDASPAHHLSVYLYSSHKLAWFESKWRERRD